MVRGGRVLAGRFPSTRRIRRLPPRPHAYVTPRGCHELRLLVLRQLVPRIPFAGVGHGLERRLDAPLDILRTASSCGSATPIPGAHQTFPRRLHPTTTDRGDLDSKLLIGLAPIDRSGILRRGRPYALACASLCLLVPMHFLPHNPPETAPNLAFSGLCLPHKSIAVIE